MTNYCEKYYIKNFSLLVKPFLETLHYKIGKYTQSLKTFSEKTPESLYPILTSLPVFSLGNVSLSQTSRL
jgi:hypothetical protein